jgi:high-affinity Fe2+/Pb2+ permease
LHNKTNAARWSEFIRGQVKTAVKGGTLFGFALVSFLRRVPGSIRDGALLSGVVAGV